jgi:hypothetical protein
MLIITLRESNSQNTELELTVSCQLDQASQLLRCCLQVAATGYGNQKPVFFNYGLYVVNKSKKLSTLRR